MSLKEFIHYIQGLMIEAGIESTQKGFASWINDSDSQFSKERQVFLQEQYALEQPLYVLIGQLTENELFRWYCYLDCLVQEYRI